MQLGQPASPAGYRTKKENRYLTNSISYMKFKDALCGRCEQWLQGQR